MSDPKAISRVSEETAQKASMDATACMEWCLGSMGRATDGASVTLPGVLGEG